jgi:hypothetical protein
MAEPPSEVGTRNDGEDVCTIVFAATAPMLQHKATATTAMLPELENICMNGKMSPFVFKILISKRDIYKPKNTHSIPNHPSKGGVL